MKAVAADSAEVLPMIPLGSPTVRAHLFPESLSASVRIKTDVMARVTSLTHSKFFEAV